jgi:hypothetical protein
VLSSKVIDRNKVFTKYLLHKEFIAKHVIFGIKIYAKRKKNPIKKDLNVQSKLENIYL